MAYPDFKYNERVVCNIEGFGYVLGRVKETKQYAVIIAPEKYFVDVSGKSEIEVDLSRVERVGDEAEHVLKDAGLVGHGAFTRMQGAGLVENYKASNFVEHAYVHRYYQSKALGPWAYKELD